MSKLDIPNAKDDELVRAAQKGKMEPYEELVHRHRDKIYARAFSMMRNEDEALDLSQGAWVKGWQRLKQFKHNASFTTWMTRICINLCLDNLRKKHNLKTCCCQNPSLSNFKPPGVGGAYTGKRYLGSRILE